MAKALSPESRNATQEILRYLAKHPEAGDTLANIAKWWIPFERLLPRWKEVEEAIASLLAQGLISETVLPSGQKFYKLVPGQLERIVRLIEEEASQERRQG